jgi:hypothetical protein
MKNNFKGTVQVCLLPVTTVSLKEKSRFIKRDFQ